MAELNRTRRGRTIDPQPPWRQSTLSHRRSGRCIRLRSITFVGSLSTRLEAPEAGTLGYPPDAGGTGQPSSRPCSCARKWLL